jgi:hypothetical protein
MRDVHCEGVLAFWGERKFTTLPELMLGGDREAMKRGEGFKCNRAAANGTDPGLFIVWVQRWIDVKVNCRAGARSLQLDVMIEAWTGVRAIEAGLVQAQQFKFAGAGSLGGGQAFESDCFDFVDKTRQAARNAIRVGVFVIGETRAEILGLADIENSIGLAAHDVNAGFARGGFEKVVAKSLDERSGQRK